MTSSISAVKAALVEVLTEALPQSQVIYGSRAAVTVTGPRLALVGRVLGRRDVSSLDLGMSELYTVEIQNSVSLATVEQQMADDLALADYDASVTAIRADITLGLPGSLQVIPTGEIELVEVASEQSRDAVVRWYVNVLAQA